jgi:hypothetical protein
VIVIGGTLSPILSGFTAACPKEKKGIIITARTIINFIAVDL